MEIYLDNAATTPVDPEVFKAMEPYFKEFYGNPSSIHSHGRKAKTVVEKCRKTVADLLNAAPSEIFFTSCATESDNTALISAIETGKIRKCITSKLEHHAVLHTLESLQKRHQFELIYVDLLPNGHINLDHLENLLSGESGVLVSLMHGNNELGNITDIETVSRLCQNNKAIFHSDTVQTMAHFKFDLQKLYVHNIVASAHKFHGPKGVGFLYINQNYQLNPVFHGGSQERNMRAGTENVAGIVGLTKAMEIAYQNLEHDHAYIQSLKDHMIQRLTDQIPEVGFNGDCLNSERSLYTILNVSLPANLDNDMLLFNMDINHISVSGGSACASGSNMGSHVLTALNVDPDVGSIRFSFSKYNTKEEIDFTINKLGEIMKQKV